MGFWSTEDAPPPHALAPSTAAELLRDTAELKETLLLATPYFAMTVRVLEDCGAELRVAAALTRTFAEHTLSSQPLRLRLPWQLTMVAGPVALKGYQEEVHHRELRLSRPPWLAPDDQRKHPRCDLPGRSTLTLTREDLQQVRGPIENLSLGGACVFLGDPKAAELVVPGQVYEVGLELEGGLHLHGWARLVQGEAPRFGLVFTKPWATREEARLRAWMEPRLAEGLRRWENRKSLRAQWEAKARQSQSGAEGILVVGSALFGDEVEEALQGFGAVRKGPPAMAALKPLLDPPPRLVVLQMFQGDLEERYRLRALWQAMALDAPLVVLGTGAASAISQTAQELRASGALRWEPTRPKFFVRMVQGILRE